MKRILFLCCLAVFYYQLYGVTNQLMITKSDGTLLMISCDDISEITFTGDVSIEQQHLVAELFQLKQNYPNPFNPTTSIEFDLSKSGLTELSIYNAVGQKVKTLISGNLKAGVHTIQWNGTDDVNKQVSSGTYFYKVSVDNQTQFKRMLMLK